MTWAKLLPEPRPQLPPRNPLTGRQLSPLTPEEEVEYLYDSRSEEDSDAGGLPPLPHSDDETENVSWHHGVARTQSTPQFPCLGTEGEQDAAEQGAHGGASAFLSSSQTEGSGGSDRTVKEYQKLFEEIRAQKEHERQSQEQSQNPSPRDGPPPMSEAE